MAIKTIADLKEKLATGLRYDNQNPPPMKPSEALRKGAEMVPQCKGMFVEVDGFSTIGIHAKAACAYGMMGIAVHGADDAMAAMETGLEYDQYVGRMAGGDVGRMVVRLNDELGCSPEEIAEYLDSKGL